MRTTLSLTLLFLCTLAAAQESNADLKRIVEEDQAVRTVQSKTDWKPISRTDAERRLLVRKMIDSGQLHTAEDYRGAALVFQHGSQPDDYLLAHSLAVIAASKGDKTGVWLAAATLDRYLQAKKQPQIYGTQFSFTDNTPASQEPYNKTLITDELRKQLGVASLEEQQAQRKELESSRPNHPTPSKK